MTVEWIVLSILISGVATWVVTLEVRLRSVQSKLLVSQQQNSDDAIIAKIHVMSGDDLADALDKNLGSSSSGVITDVLPEQKPTGKN